VAHYSNFSREEWNELQHSVFTGLTDRALQGLVESNKYISQREITEIYQPLTEFLLNLMQEAQDLPVSRSKFRSTETTRVPYVIAIAGSVAVGKTTTARILQTMFTDSKNTPRVELVSTDGFLYPLAQLKALDLVARKGFPETYDNLALIQFMKDVKAGLPEVSVPVYSHVSYDIVPDKFQILRQPDILIIEGLNVLQSDLHPSAKLEPEAPSTNTLSDFLDYSIYVDADESNIEQWYVDRFLTLRDTIFQDSGSFFHRFADMSTEQAKEAAHHVWQTINLTNLRENIAPTRERAHLIIEKEADHSIQRIRLRGM